MNKEGRGPAFYGTLFEDQAENGLGMALAVKQRRGAVRLQAEKLLPMVTGTELEECDQRLDRLFRRSGR